MKQAEDHDGISLIKGNIGEVYTDLKEYEKAYKYLFETLVISENSKDGYQQKNMLSPIGKLLYHQNKTDSALDFLFRALELNKKLNLKAEVGELYLSISLAYQQNEIIKHHYIICN